MKPFKFRVWNFDRDIFEEYDKFYISMDEDEIIYQDPHSNYEDYINPNFRYEISYSTGLFDRDGIEIFEGDIVEKDSVKYKVDNKGAPILDENGKFLEEPCVLVRYVSFVDNTFCLGTSKEGRYALNISKDWKIIGNKYEQQEPLNEAV